MIRIVAIHANRGFWKDLFNEKIDEYQFDYVESESFERIANNAGSLRWRLSQLKIFDLFGVFQTINIKRQSAQFFFHIIDF